MLQVLQVSSILLTILFMYIIIDQREYKINIYCDLGCYDGDTVEQFKNWTKILYPDKPDWQIYGFDPNPIFIPKWIKRGIKDVKFECKAAWIDDIDLDLLVDTSANPLGSTVMESKVTAQSYPKMITEAFDFSEWVKRFENDFVVVKMDCEGAEFPILHKMIEDDTISIPKLLMVEFHPNKIPEYTTTDKNDLIKEVSKYTRIVEWH